MKIIKDVPTLQATLSSLREKGKKIGFVPTMGALHQGHISLIKRSNRKADVTVCSIFVNPTQFNDKSDLDKYPRTLEADAALLEQNDTDILFAPGVEDVYPSDIDTTVDVSFEPLDRVMEGAHRPGHFAGVAQVVKRLLDIVGPDYLMMGQKDFQQFSIIQHMIDALSIPTTLVVCPIKREESGLAMSSRNVRLSETERSDASVIYRSLIAARRKKKTHSVEQIIDYVSRRLTRPNFKLEYFSLADGRTLQPIKDMDKHDYVVGCVACWVGDVRLIDNLIFKGFDTLSR